MKRIFLTLVFLYASCSFITLFAQGNDPFVKKSDPNLYVHWFYVKAEQKIDKEKKTPVYVIRVLSKTPKSGKIMEYQKDLYRCLEGGQQLTIGPFLDYKDATKALSMYDLGRYTDATMDAELKNFQDTTGNSEYYYYTLKYSITQRPPKKYRLERTAAAVASGSLKNFREALWEGLTTLNLFIGPFVTQVEAEDSKSMYRWHEEK